MGSKLNHHFVPQYLFRLFSGGERYIHLVTKPTLRIILGASIKGQCARPKFYRTEELEDELAKLDACHAAAYRAVCREAWSSSRIGLNEADIAGLYGGLMLQRARTPRTATQMADGSDRLILYAFREYVKSLPDDGTRDQILEALDKNQITLVDSEKRALMHSLRIALQDVIGITDLDFAVLRNHTDLPFIFADSPCVFYNRYLYDFESVGVLGFQSPGLMILMPIDPFTQVLLYDGNVYETYNSRTFVDLIGDSDISQLNALQVHSAKSALYFSFAPHADYVTDLIRAHRPSFKESNSEFLVHAPGSLLIKGKPADGEILQMFESQLPIKVDLSFLTVKPVPPNENPRRPRSPELRKVMRRIHAEEDRRFKAERRRHKRREKRLRSNDDFGNESVA